MSSFFRSEEMSLCQLFIQPEAIYPTIGELGDLGVAQFKDLNENLMLHERKFVAEVRRINEMERRLEVIRCELLKDETEIPMNEDEVIAYPSSREIIDLEARIEKNESEIKELSENYSQLIENQREFIEYRCVLERAEYFFDESTLSFTAGGDSEENHQLNLVAGVIDVEKFHGFETMLWRVTHGNVFLKQASIDEPFRDAMTGKSYFKIAFIAFFQGDQLKLKVKKICEGYRANIFPCSSNFEERSEAMKGLKTRIADMDLVINQTKDHLKRVLGYAAKSFNEWSVKLKKLKAIYHTMSLFSVSEKSLVGECWVPSSEIQILHETLHKGSTAAGSAIPSLINVIGTNECPPTFIRTNKFTSGFQHLIDSYGVASYREVNPAFYTIITFPFLFSVMYGDIGHGFILALIGGWMVMSEKKLEKNKEEIFQLFFSGRYIILLMGLFSIYSGFIYNDIFSKSLNLFGSSWSVNYNIRTVMENPKLQLNPSTNDLMEDRTYPMGVDPVWQLADNKILFLNSLKMKLSIIFGVVHMLFGLSNSAINFNRFKKRSSIILEFVPQVLFLLFLFGYMVFMMFFKWIKFNPKSEQPFSPGCAPSVLVYFIKMMLFGKNDALEGCESFMYPGQQFVQISFVIAAVLCIPWMLAGKPLYTMMSRKKQRLVAAADHEIASAPTELLTAVPELHEEEHPMSEIWTHQAIHTIEFVLGTVSHTASYLRLWALSLAHAQLSDVLWSKLMPLAFIPVPYVGFLFVFHIFYIWANLTFGILIVIEGLSAFLHTLRLHWVEFMDKFYDGNGKKFEPFSFETILNGGN